MSLSVLDFRRLQMTGTATFADRDVLWVPGISFITKDRNVQGMYGASVHQRKKIGNKTYFDQYQVVFAGPSIGDMSYEFHVENLNPNPHPKPNERIGPYITRVGPNSWDCNCTAGATKVDVCKHRSMVCRAIAAGLVDGARPWRGMPEAEEEESNIYFDPDLGEVELMGAI